MKKNLKESMDEWHKFEAENAKLRAALEKIIDADEHSNIEGYYPSVNGAIDDARQTLGEK